MHRRRVRDDFIDQSYPWSIKKINDKSPILVERWLKAEKEHFLEIPTHITLLTPSEVAALFRVDPKTITRWSQKGKLDCIKTVGGHRRYRLEDVQKLLKRPETIAS